MPAGGVPDIVAPGLSILFCGINPGALSGQLGQHFARPGNRFWKVLYGAGITDRILTPEEQWSLLDYHVGITNLVARPTATAAELTTQELRGGHAHLGALATEYRPAWIAIVGMQAYRTAFRDRTAQIGPQTIRLGPTGLWVLPNPSGLQARYQLPEMISMYAELRQAAY